MRKAYEQELVELRLKMEKAEKFAKKIPCFEEKIIQNKYTGEEEYIPFGERYKGIHLNWGINRCRFISGTNRTITNYNKTPYSEYLFCMYFNTLTLYDSHNKHDLEKIADKVNVYFYDGLNSTFYVKDEYIEEFLDKASEWYKEAREKEIKMREEKRIFELKKELENLENKN